MKTLYDLLGIPETATAEAVKAAFRDLAKKHHPDVNGGSAEATAIFMAIKRAYDVLSDPTKRAAYDLKLRSDRETRAQASQKPHVHSTKAPAAAPSKQNHALAPSTPGMSSFPKKKQSSGFGPVVGLGLAWLAVLAASKRSRWDRNVGRYRDGDGRFTSG